MRAFLNTNSDFFVESKFKLISWQSVIKKIHKNNIDCLRETPFDFYWEGNKEAAIYPDCYFRQNLYPEFFLSELARAIIFLQKYN